MNVDHEKNLNVFRQSKNQYARTHTHIIYWIDQHSSRKRKFLEVERNFRKRVVKSCVYSEFSPVVFVPARLVLLVFCCSLNIFRIQDDGCYRTTNISQRFSTLHWTRENYRIAAMFQQWSWPHYKIWEVFGFNMGGKEQNSPNLIIHPSATKKTFVWMNYRTNSEKKRQI